MNARLFRSHTHDFAILPRLYEERVCQTINVSIQVVALPAYEFEPRPCAYVISWREAHPHNETGPHFQRPTYGVRRLAISARFADGELALFDSWAMFEIEA